MSNSSNRWRAVPPHPVDYADLIQAIRDELGPVQGKLEELSKQVNHLAQGAVTRLDLADVRQEISGHMSRIETRYYSKELVDAKLGLQDSALRGLREELEHLTGQLKELSQRPTRALNYWVGIAAILGGSIGLLSFLVDHLIIH